VTGARERSVTQAFVSLANDLANGLDAVELLTDLTTRCGDLLDVASAGLLLADRHGVLHLAAASSEATRDLELYQLQREQGPCLDCYRLGTPVVVADLAMEAGRWPQFVAAATTAGFASVHALPMRLRDTPLGTLGLFGTRVGALSEEDLDLGAALAHVASVAIVHSKASADKDLIAEQLQNALESRVVIEQAKGFLARQGDLDMAEAFAVLRQYSRDHNLPLRDLARALITRETDPTQVLDHNIARHTRQDS
jgi:hypothetical protein